MALDDMKIIPPKADDIFYGMQIRVFTVPAYSGEEENDLLNKFLGTHRIIDVQHTYDISASAWTFCVKYIDSPQRAEQMTTVHSNAKVDYKNILSEPEFARFSALRAVRKQLSVEKGMPAYAIFTDAELASMARVEVLTADNLMVMKDVNEKHLRDWGADVLNRLSQNETTQQSDVSDSNA